MFRSMVYFELNVAYGIRYGSWFIFSAYDYPVVLMPFVEKTIFFLHWIAFAPVDLFLHFLFCSTDLFFRCDTNTTLS